MGVVWCACEHWSSLPAFITVVCTQKLMLTFHNLTQEHIQVRRECFHCVYFHVGCWARKSPPYKQSIDICCTKPTKASCATRERGTHWVGPCSASRAPNLHQGPPSFRCSQERLGTLSHSPCPAAEKWEHRLLLWRNLTKSVRQKSDEHRRVSLSLFKLSVLK